MSGAESSLGIGLDRSTVRTPSFIASKGEFSMTTYLGDGLWRTGEKSVASPVGTTYVPPRVRKPVPRRIVATASPPATSRDPEAELDLLRARVAAMRSEAAIHREINQRFLLRTAQEKRVSVLNDIVRRKMESYELRAQDEPPRRRVIRPIPAPLKAAIRVQTFVPYFISLVCPQPNTPGTAETQTATNPPERETVLMKVTDSEESEGNQVKVLELLRAIEPFVAPPGKSEYVTGNEDFYTLMAKPQGPDKGEEKPREFVALIPKAFGYGDLGPRGLKYSEYTENFNCYRMDPVKLVSYLRKHLSDGQVELSIASLKRLLIKAALPVYNEVERNKYTIMLEREERRRRRVERRRMRMMEIKRAANEERRKRQKRCLYCLKREEEMKAERVLLKHKTIEAKVHAMKDNKAVEKMRVLTASAEGKHRRVSGSPKHTSPFVSVTGENAKTDGLPGTKSEDIVRAVLLEMINALPLPELVGKREVVALKNCVGADDEEPLQNHAETKEEHAPISSVPAPDSAPCPLPEEDRAENSGTYVTREDKSLAAKPETTGTRRVLAPLAGASEVEPEPDRQAQNADLPVADEIGKEDVAEGSAQRLQSEAERDDRKIITEEDIDAMRGKRLLATIKSDLEPVDEMAENFTSRGPDSEAPALLLQAESQDAGSPRKKSVATATVSPKARKKGKKKKKSKATLKTERRHGPQLSSRPGAGGKKSRKLSLASPVTEDPEKYANEPAAPPPDQKPAAPHAKNLPIPQLSVTLAQESPAALLPLDGIDATATVEPEEGQRSAEGSPISHRMPRLLVPGGLLRPGQMSVRSDGEVTPMPYSPMIMRKPSSTSMTGGRSSRRMSRSSSICMRDNIIIGLGGGLVLPEPSAAGEEEKTELASNRSREPPVETVITGDGPENESIVQFKVAYDDEGIPREPQPFRTPGQRPARRKLGASSESLRSLARSLRGLKLPSMLFSVYDANSCIEQRRDAEEPDDAESGHPFSRAD